MVFYVYNTQVGAQDNKLTDMEGTCTTDGTQKSSETLGRIRIEQVAGSLENHPEGACTVTYVYGTEIDHF